MPCALAQRRQAGNLEHLARPEARRRNSPVPVRHSAGRRTQSGRRAGWILKLPPQANGARLQHRRYQSDAESDVGGDRLTKWCWRNRPVHVAVSRGDGDVIGCDGTGKRLPRNRLGNIGDGPAAAPAITLGKRRYVPGAAGIGFVCRPWGCETQLRNRPPEQCLYGGLMI